MTMRRRRFRALGVSLALATLLPITAAGAQSSSYVQPYGANDGGVTVMNILPPGQGRYLNALELLQAQAQGTQPAQNTNQLAMYDKLVQATPGLAVADLGKYFKDATFGVKDTDIDREYSPRFGLTVLRDRPFGVPHVYGRTRSDVMFGAGYVSAEDRLFMMDTLRYVGRGRVSEFLGASPANLAMDRAAYATSGYTEEELQAMIDRLPTLDPVAGAQAVKDVDDFTAGVNQYIDEALFDPRMLPGEYEALQQVPAPWSPTDTVAIASLIGSQLGVGGGDELGNAAFLNALLDAGYNAKDARSIFNDLREANDPEAPVTTERRFPYTTKLGPVDPQSVAIPDRAAQVAEQARQRSETRGYIDGPFGKIPLAFPGAMSNAVLVGAKHSDSGRPLAVMGPQVGYWSPQILMELDLHGPGIDARGVGFPGISMYVLLGRGQDYAWSATSAGGDQVDIYAEELCNPDGEAVELDSTFYMKGDKCEPMYTRTDSWFAKPSAGGLPEEPSEEALLVSMTTERTDDGIVQARGRVGGKPVAFVAKRASFGAEVDSALTYIDIQNGNKINSAEDFQKAFAKFAFTFNWFYLDEEDIAYQLGGYHPVRPKGTDPDFPIWGNGKWDWKGMLSFEGTPKDISPKTGYIVSWNNKQARAFRSNDSNWGYGSVYRSQMLSDPLVAELRADGKVSLIDIVNIMGNAATTDLRGFRVLPYMLKAMGAPKDDKEKEVYDLMVSWMRAGANREAATPTGAYQHAAAIAVMDAWWRKAIESIFKPSLKGAWDHIPAGFDNAPSGVGSAYQGGFYGQVEKDLRTLLGQRVKGRYSRVYCGNGKRAKCSQALLESFRAAIAELTAAYGASPSGWDAQKNRDQINYAPVGIQDQASMQWQNRPTFQQILEFSGN
jgi:acyl-homoserine lactone acylase PvdQ